MCPDRQILSLYHDGELPSPWKEKLETHLVSCPACLSRLEGYRRLSAVLGGRAAAVPAEFAGRAQGRVWEKLAARGRPAAGRGGRGSGLWNRRVAVPLPAAAAALILLAFALAAAGRGQPPRHTPVEAISAAGIGLDLPGISPAADMDGVLRYLGDTDTADVVIIRLPESKRFTSSGEPAILKAADYSKSRAAGIPGGRP